MLRPLYLAGAAYLAVCLLFVAGRSRGGGIVSIAAPGEADAAFPGAGGAWFARVKPSCNAVEVEVRQQRDVPPATDDGTAYSAACYALAGKIDRARSTIDRLPAGAARAAAAGVVFEVGHPVADAGDDAAAGPIMRLVVEYQPDNYMALYHAGMAEYSSGSPALARPLLRRFLAIYHEDDGWRANALEVLGRIAAAER